MTEVGITLHGHQIELSNGRHVFYAEKDNYHYIRFRNEDAAETKLKLSSEAADALIQLLTEPKEVYRWILHVGDGEHDAFTWERVTPP